jgi:methionyl-tRNA formyltransferase
MAGKIAMRILLFANNWVGWQVARWLKDQGEEIVGLVLHPPHKRRFGGKIVESVCLPEACVFDGSRLRHPDILQAIRQFQPDIGLSILFDYILRADLIRLFPAGVINLHPAYLPYNRGQYPNVWSIIEGTQAGVTLHYVDEGIDTGDILGRKQVPVEPVDTGETLYRKLERASVELFKETWPFIRTGQAHLIPQEKKDGTYHRTRDVERIDHVDLNRMYTGRELIDIIRARTFPPYPGAYLIQQGRKVYLRLQLLYEEQLTEEKCDEFADNNHCQPHRRR